MNHNQFIKSLTDKLETLAGPISRCVISGVDGVGKTTLADQVSENLTSRGRQVVRVSIDGFHHPRQIRYARGKGSPEGFYRDSFDIDSFIKLTLEPLEPDGDRQVVTQAFDHRTDSPVVVAPITLEAGSILLVDGIFLLQPKLQHYWDLAIWLEADFAVTTGRCAVRDGGNLDPEHEQNHRYVKGQKLYINECQPQQLADIVVDYNNLDEVKWKSE